MDPVLYERALATQRPAIDGAVMLPIGLIRPNPWNRQADPKRLAEMTDSVRKHGVLQPVLVRPVALAQAGEPLYELVAGERRWRASQAAGLEVIPALVRVMNDLEVIELNLIENLQREGLHELDEAAGYQRLLRKADGLQGFATVADLAERIGRSKSYVQQRLVLLDLCPEGHKAFREGALSFSLALRIARLPSQADQAEATKKILQGWGGDPMTARDADAYIQRTFMLRLVQAVFKQDDATLVPEAGACTACPKRTGASPDLFNDIKAGDTCTDGACYERKADAHRARLKAEAAARGVEVISGAAAKKVFGDGGRPKGYLELDRTHHQLHDSKPLRKLLGKADVKTVVVEHPRDKTLVEMVDEGQAMAALKAAGVVKTAKMPSTSASQRATDDKHKRETAWRRAVAEAIAEAARGEPGASPEYRAGLIGRVALLLWHETANDTRVRAVKLLGWPPLKGRHESGPGLTVDEHIRSLDDRELCRMLTVLTIASETHIASYQGITKPVQLLATAELLGVDVQACKDSVREIKRSTPDAVAAKRAAKKAAAPSPETALATALKSAKVKPAVKPAVKYQCRMTGQTWSGRGLQPAWVKARLLNGSTLADLAVQPAAKPAIKPTARATITAAAAATGLPSEAAA